MKDEHNEHNVIERPETPKEVALAQVAAFRKDMSEGWGWEKRAQLRDLEASVAKARRLGSTFLVDPEPHDKARAIGAKYSAALEIEWDGRGPHQYVIQLGPVVRIAGQLSGSDVDEDRSIELGRLVSSLVLDSARVEYQNESTPWLELPLGDDDQQAVTEFVKRLLVL